VMMMENLVEWWLEGETEVLGGNLPQCNFVHYKSQMNWPGLEPGLPRWEASLSYGMALFLFNVYLTTLLGVQTI
jgi:hypothetical protein